MSTDKNLNDGSVARALFRVSAPMTIGILGVLSVGLADAFFLARDGATSLAAIGYVFPVTTAMTSLSIGLSAGTNTVISQAIGKGDDDAAQQRMALHAMGLALVLGCVGAGLFYLVAPWLFSAMGAEGEVLDAILAYATFWSLSFPFLVTGMSLNAVFRASGESGVAATVMLGEAVLNIALTPLFIFGVAFVPEFGTAGAAMATLLARITSFTFITLYDLHRGVICLSCGPLKNLWNSVLRIGRVGAPAALSNAINPAGMAMVTAALATLGDTAVAGFGSATRVQSLLLVPMLALSSGIGPVVGQAWGADKKDRAQEALRLCFVICLGFGLMVAVSLTLTADMIAQIMTPSEEEAAYAAQYLRVASWGFFGYGMLVTANAAMNARDKALWSMSLSAGRIFVVYVPLTWAGVMIGGYTGVLVVAVLANVIGGWAALVAARATGLIAADWPIVRGVVAKVPKAT